MNHLKNKVAVVTGGSRGIGRAIVLKLAEAGCHVAFNFAKSGDQASALEKEAQAKGVKVRASCVDIRKHEDVKKWIDATKKEFGRYDILINNAGITNDSALMMMSEDQWQEVIDTNLGGMFHAARASIVTFMKQKSGEIINISSVSGVFGLEGQTNYSASKGGMNAFTKALAKEVARYGVRVNAIAPGFIDTELLSAMKEEKREKMIEDIPVKKIGTVDDVAHCVMFLLSEEAKYIVGQVINVDGGLAMR